MAIPGTRQLCMKRQKLFALFICSRKSEIQICSNKQETGLVLLIEMLPNKNQSTESTGGDGCIEAFK